MIASSTRPRLSTFVVIAAGSLVAALLPAVSAQAAPVTAPAGVQIKAAHSNKCLNVSGASTANSAKIVQYNCAAPATTNDKFKLVARGGGNYWIQGVGSGKCLNVQSNSTANSAAIIQYTCGTTLNGLWKVDEVLDQPTVRLIAASSGKCLNVPNSSQDINVGLIQYQCSNAKTSANEKFYLPPTTSAATVHRAFTSKQPIAVLQGSVQPGGRPAPVYYSYIRADNQLQIIVDRNPDPFNEDPNAPDPVFIETFNFGYTGRTQSARLANGRVQVQTHDAAAGDVVLADEKTAGTGEYGDIFDVGGAFAVQPSLGAVGPSGQLASFAIINGTLWFAPQAVNNPQTAYGAWRSLSGTGLTGTPVIVRTATGARVFALTTAGQVQTAVLTGTTISDWSSLGGSGLTGTPSVVLTGTQASIFIRSGDGTVVTKKQNSDGTFPADWSPIPGLAVVGSPSAVVDPTPGRIALTARGTDNLIYLAYEVAQGSGEFSEWVALSDEDQFPGSTAASDPTAFSYQVPSGASFGVAFQSTDDEDVPFVFTFTPGAAAGKKATVARGATPKPQLHTLEKPATSARLK